LEMEWQTVNFSEVERATAGRVISWSKIDINT
jgi:hypothetical protein